MDKIGESLRNGGEVRLQNLFATKQLAHVLEVDGGLNGELDYKILKTYLANFELQICNIISMLYQLKNSRTINLGCKSSLYLVSSSTKLANNQKLNNEIQI